MRTLPLALALAAFVAGTPAAAQHPTMPPGMTHEEHLRQMKKDAELKERGALAMGFDQDKTVHHFLLQRAGGAIVVTSKDGNDRAIVAQVRAHFRDIAEAFRDGAFDKPVATHGELPPGAATMAANRARIAYRYEERPGGAAVVIETSDAATLAAIHEFLRYQIVEHKTGDPLEPR
jgi:hypothetical protein